ncbi:MAG: hypothetical protein CHACPFDD_01719 [Phycisphaerae bacterium]|nr:hypothetical protein [Phycisphaerae bacterium]
MTTVCCRLALVGLTLSLLLGGCPADSGRGDPAVSAVIGISTTQGDPPLRVQVTAADSTSRNGEIVAYAWDFGGQASSDQREASHTFTAAGRHLIRLTVTDETGEIATNAVEVRVNGTDANQPTARIVADVTSGAAPLTVFFDGRSSSADSDSIVDYFWEFGDGQQSRRPDPSHVFLARGEYTVTLRVVTGGGLDDSENLTITVAGRASSLQFNGGQHATLPLADDADLTTLTVEAWFKVDATGGGRLLQIGDALALDVNAQAKEASLTLAGAPISATLGAVSGEWHHLAISFDAANAVFYLDGGAIGEHAATATLVAADAVLGRGFRGSAADVRLWSVARTASEISANYKRQLSGLESGLAGYWRLDEGQGQAVANSADTTNPGYLGSGTNPDAADAAWSSDGPPVNP